MPSISPSSSAVSTRFPSAAMLFSSCPTLLAPMQAILRDRRTHLTVLHVNGAPAGFYELFHDSDELVELCHFGLIEHALGMGVGKWFLLQALYAAWALEPRKVSVTTNNLDHPRALQLYQMFGFNPVATSDALVRPLSEEEILKLHGA